MITIEEVRYEVIVDDKPDFEISVIVGYPADETSLKDIEREAEFIARNILRVVKGHTAFVLKLKEIKTKIP